LADGIFARCEADDTFSQFMPHAEQDPRGVARRAGLWYFMNATPTPVPQKWSWHYRALTRLRETLLRETSERDAESRTPVERGGTDAVDVANDESDHVRLLAQISQEQTELTEVEAALERIKAGTYGACEITGKPIAAERLRAIPWTRLSQKAAAARERSGGQL
jgi:RNA polymerase-binding transcription factor DksA